MLSKFTSKNKPGLYQYFLIRKKIFIKIEIKKFFLKK